MQLVQTILYVALITGIVTFAFGFRVPFRGILSVPPGGRMMAFTWLVLYFGMGLWFGRLGKPTTLAEVDQSAVVQILSIAFAFLVAMFGFMKGYGLSNLKGPLLLLFVYALLGVLTAPLSPVPTLSAFKAGSLVVVALVAAVAVDVMGKVDAKRVLLNSAYLYLGLLTFLAVLGGILFPEITHRPNKGIFGMMLVGWPALNSNSLSFISATISIVGLRRFFEPSPLTCRVFYLGVLVVAFSVLLLAQGRTSIIGFFLAVLLLSSIVPGIRLVRRWLVIWIAVVFSIYLLTGEIGDWLKVLETYLRRGSDDESLKTLSGRTEVWSAGWQIFLQSPVFGYGFYAAEKLGIAAHNAYILVLINNGLVGFVFWVSYMYWGMLGALRDLISAKWRCDTEEQRFRAETYGVLIVLFLRTITGSDLTTHHYSTMIFVAWLVYRAIDRKREDSPRDEEKADEKLPESVENGLHILSHRRKYNIKKRVNNMRGKKA